MVNSTIRRMTPSPMRKPVRVFIASPGDVAEERDICSHVVAELNRVFSGELDVSLEAVRWETHAWPDVGVDGQDVINRQISEYDVLVGILWRRFGTPTKRSTSGTGEEFQRAYELFKAHGRPKIMFYFRSTPFYSTSLNELRPFNKVIRFQKQLEGLGVFYWTYDAPLSFERHVREHLTRQLLDLRRATAAASTALNRPKLRLDVDMSASRGVRVFLAYSHSDRGRVREIHHLLQAAGHRPWMDEQELLPGQRLVAELEGAIRRSQVVLLFLSADSRPEDGYLVREATMAIAARRDGDGPTVVPVRLDPVTPPPDWNDLQTVDLFVEDGTQRLLALLERIGASRRTG